MNLDPKVLKDLYGDQEPMVNPFPEARKYKPQDVAQGLGVQQHTGVDAILAAQRLPEFQAELDQNYWNKMVQDSPKTAKFMAASPVHAALLKDDADSGALNTIAAAAKWFTSAPGAKRGLLQDVGDSATLIGVGGLAGMGKMVFDAGGMGADLLGAATGSDQLRNVGATWRATGTRAGEAIGNLVPTDGWWASDTGKAVGAGLSSAGTNVLMLPLGLSRAAAGAVSSGAGMVAGLMGVGAGADAYSEARNANKDALGALLYAVPQGAFEYAFEKIPAGKLFADLAAGKTTAKAMIGQVVPELWTEQLTTVAQDFNTWMNLHPEKTTAEFIAERPDAAYQTLVATLIGVGVQTGAARTISKTFGGGEALQARAQQAEQVAQVLESMQTTMQASEVLKHSPATLQAYAQSLVDDGAENIHIDAAKLVEAGIDLNVLAQAMPSVASQLEQAQTGGDLVIPTGELLVGSLGQEFQQVLIDHARTDVNGMSRVEATAYMQDKGDAVNAEIERVMGEQSQDAEFKAGREELHGQLLQQLNDVGRFSPLVNKQYATLASNFYAVMAARTGMTVQKFADTYQLGFKAEAVGGQRTLDQFDQAGALVTDTPAFKNWFGDSKVVGADGHPMTLYTGGLKWDTADLERGGRGALWLTPDVDNAAGYADQYSPNDGREIKALYANISNPLDLREQSTLDAIFGEDDAPTLRELQLDRSYVEKAIWYAKAHGHDGLIHPDSNVMNRGGELSYVVFSGTQIKSAQLTGNEKHSQTYGINVRGGNNNGNFDPKDANILHQAAYHGTPHRGIDKFSTDHMGSGEGAQAFGWGLYFAGKRGVAEHYREAVTKARHKNSPELSASSLELQNAITAVDNLGFDSVQAALITYKRHPDSFDLTPAERQRLDDALASHAAVIERINSETGQLYEVEIPDDDKMLDFNKEWSGQSAEVKAALNAAGVLKRYKDNLSDFGTPMATRNKKMRGENIYAFLSHELGGDKAASQYLDSLGVPGMKYKGGTIAGVTSAGHNYVLFHGDHAEVKSTYYQPGDAGPFGPISTDFHHDAQGAITHLIEAKDGEAIGALYHPELGDIDLVWGEEGTNEHNGYGLSKLVRWHSEVLNDLQNIVASMLVTKRSENRVQLESADHKGGVRLQWDGVAKHWLLTAFEKDKGGGTKPSTDTLDAKGQDDSPADTPERIVDAAIEKFNQGARGQIAFANDITQQASVISMLKNADLSTFIHEGGHFFLEVQADLANKIAARIAAGEQVTDGERSILDDMNTTLDWMGVKATPEMSALDHWAYKTLEEKRAQHEQWARGFEAYAFEGKSPSLELTKMFQTFRAWLVNVYKALLKSVNASGADIGGALEVQLSDEVRGVMDRMLATTEQIAEAEAARNMGPLFKTMEEAGMDLDAYKAYHDMGTQHTMDATDALQARGLRDMQWLHNARSRKLKALQKQHDALRLQIAREVRADVMSQPIYRAWTFLTSKAFDKVEGDKPVGKSKGLNPEVDNLFEAIAKLGGLDRAEVKKLWGIDEKEKLESGVFGSPVVRKTGGLSTDAMAERLLDAGYLLPDENGKADHGKFEALFDDQRRGVDRYSIQRDMAAAYGDAPAVLPDMPATGYGRLATEELRRRYGTKDDAVWRKLSALRMTSDEGGLDPDVVAELFGFNSGDELVKTLAATEPPKSVIEGKTDQRMLEEHGDIATPAGLERAADAAIHNDARVRFVATELRALQHAVSVREKVPGQKNTVDVLVKAAREYADKTLARMKIKNIKPNQYAVAAARAGREADKARGDLNKQAEHKRNQLINTQAVKAATEAREQIQKMDLFFRRVVSAKDVKTRDTDIVMAARAVLANFGYGAKAKKAAEYLESVKQYDPALYDVLRQSVDAAELMAKPFNDLTFEELQGVHAEVESLWHLALRSKQMEIDGNMVDQEEVAQELADRMDALGVPVSIPGDHSAVTEAEARAFKFADVKAILRRVESWVDLKDGLDKMGAFRRNIWTPIKEAADRYRADKLVHLRGFRAAFDGIAHTMVRETIHSPELGYTFGKDTGGVAMNEILHAILHTGNESNKRKLLLGRGWATEDANGAMDTRRWDAFTKRMADEGKLTKAHYEFAQRVWDLLESTKPLAQKAHRDAYGRYFDEITASAVDTPFGVFSGGYVPANVDGRVVKDNELKKLIEEGKEGMAYAFPGTSKGFTKGRVEYNKPLVLDLRTLPQHIDKVLLFSHMENPVRDASKLLASAPVSTRLNRQDPSAINVMLIPWLTRSARQSVTTPVPGAGWVMRGLNTLRNRTGMATMMANVSNTVQQVTGFMLAGVKVKPGYMAGSMAQYMKAPKAMAENVAAMSQYMANRMSNEVGAMMGEIETILIDPTAYQSAKAWTMHHTYFMQSAVDNVMGPVIWSAAHDQALAEGYELKDAIRIADGVIRQTQGSTLPEDVSRLETGPAYARVFTQFYGYFNMQSNLLGTEFAKIPQEIGLRKGMGRGALLTMMAFYAPALVAEAIAQMFRGGPGDEDKDGEWLDDWLMTLFVTGPMRNALAFIPFAGSALNAGINRFNGNPMDDKMSMSPVVGAIEAAVSVPYDLYKIAVDEGNAQKTIKDVATLISVTTGLPASVAARPVGYLASLAQGKTEPTGAVDAVRGTITGVASKESKVP
jgi:hypothetical protein